MKKIRVGIIGQGRSGRNIHGVSLERPKLREKFEIAAVADLRPDRTRESCENNPGCKAYTDYREMLKNPELDLIVNASMSPDHTGISIEALEAGYAVLSEKPLARHVADVDRLSDANRRTGRFFAVFQQSRFAPAFRKIREVMDSGILGRIVQIRMAFNGFARRWDWQTLQDMCAGNLLNTGPHPLDQALQLMGDIEPDRIFCLMDRAHTFGDAEDHVKLLMSAQGHPSVDLEISSCSMYNPHVYSVYGTCGCLAGSHTELEWKYFLPEEAPEQHLIRTPLDNRAYCSETLSFYEGKWTSSPEGADFNSRVERFYENLYGALVHGTPLEVTLEQVRRQIAVIEECHRQNPLPKR